MLKDAEQSYKHYCKIYNRYIEENPMDDEREIDDRVYYSMVRGRMKELLYFITHLKDIINKSK